MKDGWENGVFSMDEILAAAVTLARAFIVRAVTPSLASITKLAKKSFSLIGFDHVDNGHNAHLDD